MFQIDVFGYGTLNITMSHLFMKKAKTSQSSELPPQPPSVDQIVEDLEVAKPDDIVFTTDIGLIDVNNIIVQQPEHFCEQADFVLPSRFQTNGATTKQDIQKGKSNKEENDEVDDLYEKVIEYNQNVEKLVGLHQTLPKVLKNISQLKDELEEDKNRVSDTYMEAVKLYQEVSEQENKN